jgi:Protein of unknown function (DUF3293)
MAEHALNTAAYITAYTPYSQHCTQEENRLANDALHEHLGNRAFALFDAEGADPTGEWLSEPGFLVLGLELEDARGVGVFFRQNAIVSAGQDALPQLVMLVDDGR